MDQRHRLLGLTRLISSSPLSQFSRTSHQEECDKQRDTEDGGTDGVKATHVRSVIEVINATDLGKSCDSPKEFMWLAT